MGLSCTEKWAGSDCLGFPCISGTGPQEDKKNRTEPERPETRNLQDLQVLPCWLTENLLSPVALLLCGCCLHRLLLQNHLQHKQNGLELILLLSVPQGTQLHIMVTPHLDGSPAIFLPAAKPETPKGRVSLINHQADFLFFFFVCPFFHF